MSGAKRKKTTTAKRKKGAPVSEAAGSKAPERRLELEYVPIDDLQEWSLNPRVNDAAAERLAGLMGQYGFVCPIIASPDKTIRAGHTRLKAARQAGLSEVPVIFVEFASEEEAELFAIADNKAGEWASWDEGMLADLFDQRRELGDEQIAALSGFERTEIEGLTGEREEEIRSSLREKFLVPPFSVLDARQGYWRERKEAWLSLGLQGEVGRGEDLLGLSIMQIYKKPRGGPRPGGKNALAKRRKKHTGGDARLPAARSGNFYKQKAPFERKHGAISVKDFAATIDMSEASGTSVFDPVLCELVYRWFCPKGGHILDPFAGGATRGVVASFLGFDYTGIEIRKEQVEANRRQAKDIKVSPRWVLGDSAKMPELLGEGAEYDLVWTSPPYFDLEIYSKDINDGSAFESYEKFIPWYESIFASCVDHLRENRFLAVVVGEIRERKGGGSYRNFVGDTISTFKRLGLQYYNEIILVTEIGSLSLRAGKIFQAGRKIGKTHQNVLVFFKGNPQAIKSEFGEVDVPDPTFGEQEAL